MKTACQGPACPGLFATICFLVASAAGAETLEGFYARGPQLHEFAPCGEGRVFQVDGDATLLQELHESYDTLTTSAYEPVYVWLEGKREQRVDLSGQDYDGVFEIRRLRLMRMRHRDDCITPVDLSGQGLEYLYDLVDRTPRETALFRSLPLRQRLEDLLGEALPLFLDNMQIQGPLRRAGSVLYCEGTGPDAGEGGVLVAAPGADRLTVIVITGGDGRAYFEGDAPLPLPRDVQEFINGLRRTP